MCRATPARLAPPPRCRPRERSPCARPRACSATTWRRAPATPRGARRCGHGRCCRCPRRRPTSPSPSPCCGAMAGGSQHRPCWCPRAPPPMSRRPAPRRRPSERGCRGGPPWRRCLVCGRCAPPSASNRRQPAPARAHASPRVSTQLRSCPRSGSPAWTTPQCRHAPTTGNRHTCPARRCADPRPGPSRTAREKCVSAHPRRHP
mmetsp:Transcript_124052/g.358770  ORF Transcript_124052/g.358770 Transcript_124052/m.358770 type:complete len:204 (-) Transcript_124052:287-898(-)